MFFKKKQEKVNLKTHTVYPEIVINPNLSYSARLIDLEGNVIRSTQGIGKTKDDCRKLARQWVDYVIKGFKL